MLQKGKKIEGGPLGDIEKNCEKKSHKAEITCKKIGQRRDSDFCSADLKKALLTSMPSASRSSVAVSVSASQLIKHIKSVTSLVLKKSLL